MEEDKVSVIIPTKDREEYIKTAVGSILHQTYINIEAIVVDGSSTDETKEIIKKIDSEQLSIILQERSASLGNARNIGIEQSSGEYIVFLDDDDILHPSAVETLVTTIKKQPESCVGAYTAKEFQYLSEESKVIEVTDGIVNKHSRATINGPSGTLVKRDIFNHIGYFDESLPGSEDTDFWIRLFQEYSMIGINEVLCERRIHEDNISREADRMLRAHKMILEKHRDRFGPSWASRWEHNICHDYAKTGQYKQAKRKLGHAIKSYPWRIAHYYYLFFLLFGGIGYRIGRTLHREIYPRIKPYL